MREPIVLLGKRAINVIRRVDKHTLYLAVKLLFDCRKGRQAVPEDQRIVVKRVELRAKRWWRFSPMLAVWSRCAMVTSLRILRPLCA